MTLNEFGWGLESVVDFAIEYLLALSAIRMKSSNP
jgi:hypothetical protein